MKFSPKWFRLSLALFVFVSSMIFLVFEGSESGTLLAVVTTWKTMNATGTDRIGTTPVVLESVVSSQTTPPYDILDGDVPESRHNATQVVSQEVKVPDLFVPPVTEDIDTVIENKEITKVTKDVREEKKDNGLTKAGSQYGGWADDDIVTVLNKTIATSYCFAQILGGSGLGSQLMNFFSYVIYLKEKYGRVPIAIDAYYHYRRNASVGVLAGFFTPQFPVIATTQQHHAARAVYHELDERNWEKKYDPYQKIWLTRLVTFRADVRKRYTTDSLGFYHKMVDAMCPHLKFNEETLREITAIEDAEKGFPKLFNQSEPSVSFHIRRGDKLVKESRRFNASEYVARLRSVAPNDVTFQHCLLASDDPLAKKELQLALQASNMTCSLHTLSYEPNPKATSKTIIGKDRTLLLLAELSFMIRSTYFVGTFNSNVGALVAVLRGCHQPDQRHYARSYGVNTDKWYLP